MQIATPYLTPAQVRAAYGLNAITQNGAGQTLAIVDAFHDPYIQSDLNTFDNLYGLPNTALSVVNLAGNVTNDGWASEESLDVEWAHAIAPGAHIDVVEASSDGLTALMQAVNVARSLPGVSVVSMSWGSGEFATETSLDPILTTPAAHNGVSFVAATGDGSAYGGAQWPASSPNVVAVGGTSLAMNSAGMTLAETAWFWGGGGISSFEREPFYQAGVQASGARTTPDVSADAGTPVVIFTTAPSTGIGSLQLVQGTSIATPIIAAIIADSNQALVSVGQPTLDSGTGVTQFRLFQAEAAAAFHDVTAGFNGFVAQTGYDLASGLGTPSAPVLIASLVGSGTSPGSYPGFALAPPKPSRAITAGAHHRAGHRQDVQLLNTPSPGFTAPGASAPTRQPAEPIAPPSAAPLAPAPSGGSNIPDKAPVPMGTPEATYRTSTASGVAATRINTRDREVLDLILDFWGLGALR
jgi:hypothetical protein